MIWIALGALVLAYFLAASGWLFLGRKDTATEAALFAARNQPPKDCRDVLTPEGEPLRQVI